MLWGVNYYSAGKEFSRDLKVLLSSPWNVNIVLEGTSHKCFQKQFLQKPQDDPGKVRGGRQNLKDCSPLS